MNRRRIKIGLGAAGAVLCAALGVLIWKSAVSPDKPFQIVLIQKALDDTDFWTSVYQGGEMAAAEYGAELTVMGPEKEQEIELQNKMILEAIEQKPDAIVLAPCSSKDTLSYAHQIEEAGITLVLLDSTMEEPAGEAVVATDNYELGYKMGSYMKQFVKEDTVIGIVGHVQGSSTALGREEGFRAGLGEDEERVAEIVFCDSDTDKAYELTCGLLEKYPDMDMIVGLNEYSAVGAARAVKEQGLADSIHMAGIDSSVEQIQLLEEGVYEALAIQKPFNMGYLGVETAEKLLQGESVEEYIDSGSELITKENMYTEENQKLLFPVEE
ncbi:MAG TPA: substrate-binding domain-containing protein [Candidatus Merdisoma merdipullorum]|nr:substrate-binding domain-containing protein [Candidatus Merdisoma merdipullorum]